MPETRLTLNREYGHTFSGSGHSSGQDISLRWMEGKSHLDQPWLAACFVTKPKLPLWLPFHGVALDSPKVKPLRIPSSREDLRSKESAYTLYEISWWHERTDILTVSHGGSVQLHVRSMSPHYWSTSPCQWSVKHDHPSIHVLVTKSYASLIWLLTRNLFRIIS